MPEAKPSMQLLNYSAAKSCPSTFVVSKKSFKKSSSEGKSAEYFSKMKTLLQTQRFLPHVLVQNYFALEVIDVVK